jgi:hypothetical protein
MSYNHLWIALLGFYSMTGTGDALIAFNCQHDDAVHQAINTMEPGPCPDPVTDFLPPRYEALQVIQTSTREVVEATACKITVTSEVTRCGFDSLTYGSLRT